MMTKKNWRHEVMRNVLQKSAVFSHCSLYCMLREKSLLRRNWDTHWKNGYQTIWYWMNKGKRIISFFSVVHFFLYFSWIVSYWILAFGEKKNRWPFRKMPWIIWFRLWKKRTKLQRTQNEKLTGKYRDPNEAKLRLLMDLKLQSNPSL